MSVINNFYKYGLMIVLVVLILMISNLNQGSPVNLIITSFLIILMVVILDNYSSFERMTDIQMTRKNDLLQQNSNDVFISTSKSVPIDNAEIIDFNNNSERVNILLNNLNCNDFKPSSDTDIQYNILYRMSDTGEDVNYNDVIFKQ